MKYLYRFYLLVIGAPVIAVSTIITALITVIGTILGFGKTLGYYPEVYWSRVFCWLAFVKVKVEGRDNINKSTSYVFVANHEGAFDIFSIYGYLDHNIRWMMKSSLGKIPVVGWACRWSHQIYVDHSSPAATRRTMEAAEKQLKDGMSLVVFPEGSRTRDGKMLPFRKGAFRLALEFKLPVVPITINGSYEVMPCFHKFPTPGTVTFTIHKPILCSDQKELMARVKEEIEKGLHD